MLDPQSLYPSVVPRSYLTELGYESCSYAGLGPNLVVMLWHDLSSAFRSVSPVELSQIEMTEDAAWAVAMGNLSRELTEGRLQVGIGNFEDGGKAAFLDGHWLASATIFHAGLYPWFRAELGCAELCALVSERDSAVIFASDCSDLVREKAELFISKAAQFSRKPFGRNFYRLEDDGPIHVL